MHKTWDYGPGYQREFRPPSGQRVDAINFQTRRVVELKPNNPRAIRRGRQQLAEYLAELNYTYPGDLPWTGSIQSYTRPLP